MYQLKATITWMSDIETIRLENTESLFKREIVISQGPDFPASTILVSLYGDKATNPLLAVGKEFLFDIRFFVKAKKQENVQNGRPFFMEARVSRMAFGTDVR